MVSIARQLEDLDDRTEGLEGRLGDLVSRLDALFKVRDGRAQARAPRPPKKGTP